MRRVRKRNLMRVLESTGLFLGSTEAESMTASVVSEKDRDGSLTKARRAELNLRNVATSASAKRAGPRPWIFSQAPPRPTA